MVSVMVLSGNGINCEYETATACTLGGADRTDVVHINELLQGERSLESYHLLCLPGGFLDGDDLGSGKACANRFRHATVTSTGEPFWDQLLRFVRAGKLILGICNGFQLMVKMGLVPALGNSYGTQVATVTRNDSNRFEDRWVHLKVNPASPCVFTKGIERLYLPVRHGEGKFLPADPSTLDDMLRRHLVCLQYTDGAYRAPTMEYPFNPNGAQAGVAGICDETGRLFGLMPHPEAYLHRTNHPRWTREILPEEGAGVALFRNAIAYIREHLL
jgi:phosphoribosylformylglycinamidine synthase